MDKYSGTPIEAHEAWHMFDQWKNRGQDIGVIFWGRSARSRVNPEIESVFSKLGGGGLVARIAPPNHLNVHADFQNRSVLLKKGLPSPK